MLASPLTDVIARLKAWRRPAVYVLVARTSLCAVTTQWSNVKVDNAVAESEGGDVLPDESGRIGVKIYRFSHLFPSSPHLLTMTVKGLVTDSFVQNGAQDTLNALEPPSLW